MEVKDPEPGFKQELVYAGRNSNIDPVVEFKLVAQNSAERGFLKKFLGAEIVAEFNGADNVVRFQAYPRMPKPAEVTPDDAKLEDDDKAADEAK